MYSLTNYVFIVPVSMRFAYDQVSPHEYVSKGYETGIPRGFVPNTQFYSMQDITPDRIQELLRYLGWVYKRANIDPVDLASQHLERIRSV